MTWRPVPRAGLGAAALVALAWLATTALAGERRAELGRLAASGAISLSNSRDGAAILQAGGFWPGASVSGSVTLQNTGDAAGLLALDRTGLQETTGRGGGLFSQALPLRIQDASGADAYVGALSALAHLDLGALPAGAARTYRFTLSFPTGAGRRDPLLRDKRPAGRLGAPGLDVERRSDRPTPGHSHAGAHRPTDHQATGRGGRWRAGAVAADPLAAGPGPPPDHHLRAL